MSPESKTSAHSNESKASPSDDTLTEESGFELLDDGEVTQTVEPDEEMFWFARSDSTEPMGPVSTAEIRKRIASGEVSLDSLAWCKGMPQWAKIADHFDISESASIDNEISQPPPLSSSSDHLATLEFLKFVCNWTPTPFIFRILARCFLIFGLLTIAGSVVLLLFGKSWFTGGLQFLLISSVLELTAVVRANASPGTTAQD